MSLMKHRHVVDQLLTSCLEDVVDFEGAACSLKSAIDDAIDR